MIKLALLALLGGAAAMFLRRKNDPEPAQAPVTPADTPYADVSEELRHLDASPERR